MNNRLKNRIVWLLFSFFIVSCGSADQKVKTDNDIPSDSIKKELLVSEYNCDNIQKTFGSFEEAKAVIDETEFRIEESVNTSSSSWIRGAFYYSCDGQTGFLMLLTDKHDYLYSEVPIDVWLGFKEAESFGSYYNQNIRNNYFLELN